MTEKAETNIQHVNQDQYKNIVSVFPDFSDPVVFTCVVINVLCTLPEKYGNGYISKEELCKVIRERGCKVTETLLEDVVDKLSYCGLLTTYIPNEDRLSWKFRFCR